MVALDTAKPMATTVSVVRIMVTIGFGLGLEICLGLWLELKMTRQEKTHSKYYNILIEIEIIVSV